MPDEHDVDVIAAELGKLAIRLIDCAFDDTGKQEALDIKPLRDIAERSFRELWHQNPTEALEVMLKHAISRLNSDFYGISEQEAALLYFNLDGAPLGSDIEKLSLAEIDRKKKRTEKRYTYLRRRLKERAPYVGDSTIRTRLQELRTAIASILADRNFPSAPATTETPDTVLPTSLFGSIYVARPELHTEFRRLTSSQVRVICLTGDRGYGKSRLAREFVREMHRTAGRDFIWLDCADQDRLYDDLRNVLAARGVEVAGKSRTALRSELIDYVATASHSHPVIVLDDAKSWERIEPLIPSEPSTLYLITSNDGRILPKGRGNDIVVDSMEDSQALELARSLLSQAELSDDDLCSLAVEALNGRPLAIEHACGFIEGDQGSVEKFLTQLNENAQVAFAAGDRALAWIYEQTINELRHRSDRLRFRYKAAWVLLRVVAYLDHNRMPRELLSSAHGLLWSKQEESRDTTAEFAFAQALDELQRRHLVAASDDGLTMHSLTRDIVRDILRPEAKEIVVAIQQGFLQNAESVLPFGPLPFNIVLQVHPVKTALLRLPEATAEEWRALRLGHSLALVCRGLEDLGDIDCRSELLSRFASHAPPERWWDHIDYLEFQVAAARAGYNDRGVREPNNDESIGYADAMVGVSSRIHDLADAADPYHKTLAIALDLEAYMTGFRPDRTIETLEKDESQLVAEPSATPSTLAWRGELLLRLGEARERLAQWDSATDTLERSRALFAAAGDDFIYGQMKALARLAWCNAKDVKATSADNMIQLRELYQSDVYRCGVPLAAEVAHAWGASTINHLMRKWFIEVPVDPQLRENGLNALREAKEHYETIRRRRGVLAVEYDLLRLDVAELRDPASVRQKVGANHAEAQAIGDEELVLMYRLLLAKISILLHDEDPESIIDTCMTLASKAASLSLAYWYNQAVLTAWLTATICQARPSLLQRLEPIVQEIIESYSERPGGIYWWVLSGKSKLMGMISY